VPERSEDAANGDVPGNGVGLTVVDSVVAAHGGELSWDRGQPGAVTVTVRLPVAADVEALVSAGA